MIRISLIVALLAGLAIAVVNFVFVKEKMTTLLSDRNTQRDGRVAAETELASTKQTLETTSAKLKTTEETLATTSKERDDAVTERDRQVKRATELATALEATTTQRDTAQADLARYKQSGFTPEQLTTLAKDMKNLNDTIDVVNEEKRILQRSLARATNELARLIQTDWKGPALPANLRGKVLVADPKWDFVVIDVGTEKGMENYGELLVSRDGKLVGKVRVRFVEKDRSIANLIPGSVIGAGTIMEGDEVIPANPAAS
jgi:septal ring factor EnvC (AmiA/AmiB activator)